jgi:CheY-like chemotaxis protein
MPHTFLVTDGDRTSLELIRAVLTRDGFEVVATPDGADALARARESSPAVVICAAELPGLSGEELCRQIKAQSSETRVVLLHREGPEGADAQAVKLTAGCDAIIETPFKYPALKKHLVDWGLLSEAGSASAATVPAPDSFGVPVPAPEPIKFEAPGPVAPPDTAAFGVAPTAPPAPASAPSSPFTPIPLPIAPATPQFDDDLPELELGAVAEDSIPEPRAAEPAVTPAPTLAPAAQTSPPAPGPTPAPVRQPSGQLTLPLEGDLAQVPLPRLLYELYVATFTGVVQITRASVARTVFIRSGIPVHVDSHQMAEMLGRLLVEHGRITMDEYARSLQVMQTQGIRQGEALVQIGALRQSELLDAMRLQTEVKLSNAFTWRDGHYRIEPGPGFEGGTILCEVQPISAIWRGVHEHYDLESLLTYFAGLTGKYAVATEMFAVHCDSIAPYIRDLELLAVLDGSTTFDAALADQGRQLRVAQALYVLLVTDMIEAADGPGAAATVPQSAAAPGTGPAARGAAAKTAAAAPADPEELQRIADEIARDYMRLKESDYFDALRLEPTSTADEVDVAYENLVRALRLDDLPDGLPPDVVSRAREIGDILNRARMVLRDPRMRERYLAGQQQQYGLPGDPSVGAQPEQAAAPMAGSATLELDVDGSRQASIIAERAYQAGLGLMQAERWEDAGRKFQEAIAAAPREPAYRVALGRAIVAAEGIRHEATRHKAATCVQQALQLDPSNLEANLEMAKLLAASGKRDRAYSYVQRVLQRSPDHPEARQVLASLG